MNEPTVLTEAKHFVRFQRRQIIPKMHIFIDTAIDICEQVLSVAMGVIITIVWAASDGQFDLRLGIFITACMLYAAYALADFLFGLLKVQWDKHAARLRSQAEPSEPVKAEC